MLVLMCPNSPVYICFYEKRAFLTFLQLTLVLLFLRLKDLPNDLSCPKIFITEPIPFGDPALTLSAVFRELLAKF